MTMKSPVATVSAVAGTLLVLAAGLVRWWQRQPQQRKQQQQQPQQQQQQPQQQRPQQLARRVFISHAGKSKGAGGANLPTGVFAASILQPSLEAAGLQVFMDYSSLDPGCEWPARLMDAAAHSAVVVVVLSAEYVRRFWCMLELDAALHGVPGSRVGRTGAPLMVPVFYDSPADVASALQQHDWQGWLARLPADRRPLVDPTRWAANVAAMDGRLQGLRLRSAGAPKDEEVQLARRVVAAAVAAVPPQAAVHALGFKQQAAQLTAELVVPDDARLGLWLHGPGGLGKSTMARLLFNRLAPVFAHSAFLELDTEEGASKAQTRLASALEQLGARGFSATAGAPVLRAQLQQLLCEKTRRLLVLDNVWAAQQLDALLPPLEPSSGLCVIVTSRFVDLPGSSAWQAINGRMHQHQLSQLGPGPATQLFRQHSGQPSPSPQLAELEAGVVAACAGLPLALIIIGGQLWQQTDARVWQGVLDSMRAGAWSPESSSEQQLSDVLELSFRDLSPAAQSMFLDSVSVLHGRDSEAAAAVWEGWWGTHKARLAWAELQRRSLVGVDGDGDLAVHDVIRALGQAMLREPRSTHYGSRVWVTGAGELLELSKAPRQPLLAVALHGLRRQQVDALDWSSPCWQPLDQLRLFLCKESPTDPEWPLPLLAAKQLLWLELRECSQLIQLPEAFVQLSALQQLELGQCEALRQLPDSFGQLSALQQLDLSGCSLLGQLPDSFGQLSALQQLDLGECSQLSQLPDSFGQLSALQQLDLGRCSQLGQLPDSFGQLSALQGLYLSGCSQLRQLPHSFGQLSALQQLDLDQCSQLGQLPDSFGQLSALQGLYLRECSQLGQLPDSFGQLSALQQLDLRECSQLGQLPDSFGQLSALQLLDLSECSQLVQLPDSFGQLSALQRLDLSGCSRLTDLRTVPAHVQIVTWPPPAPKVAETERRTPELPQPAALRVDAAQLGAAWLDGKHLALRERADSPAASGMALELEQVWWLDVSGSLADVPPGAYEVRWMVDLTSAEVKDDEPLTMEAVAQPQGGEQQPAGRAVAQCTAEDVRELQQRGLRQGAFANPAARWTLLRGGTLEVVEHSTVRLRFYSHEGWKGRMRWAYAELVPLER